ncbi:unnamed protein product [Owenia fusiformis]|uniref:Uncharacterized protein n=1 Tax=Owenia fusiformis TaxID=6347 RepID=A0A8S4N259_OWEFU|nr:unnamed protein product [Owenia fusiformis]
MMLSYFYCKVRYKNILKLFVTIGIFGIIIMHLMMNNYKLIVGRSLIHSDGNATYSDQVTQKRRLFVYTNNLYDQHFRAKRPLEATEEMLQRLQIPPPESSFVELSEEMLQNFVFVTASSRNHFNESLELIGGIQTYYPDRDIYYYDIGLEDENVAKIKTMCRVKYRQFDFEAYPPHVSIIKTYAFKPLIIKEMMTEHRVGVFWVDSSIRFKTGETETLWEKMKNGNGLVLFINTFINKISAVTHPDMYEFLPADEQEMRGRTTYGCGALLIYNTKFAYEHFFQWFLLCALNAQCIAPVGSRIKCDEESKDRSAYRNCHRFDQSALNILISNMYNFWGNFEYEICDTTRLFVTRKETNMFELNFCM